MVTNNSSDYSPTQYNVQSGGANGTLNNIVPTATVGVPLISQNASTQPIFGTAVVAGGGTGATSFNINGPIISSTTTTGALSSITLANQQFLVGNTSAAPTAKTWTTKNQVFTATGAGTYTPTAGMVYCLIELVAGGGGSGGVAATGGSTVAISASGGGGGYSRGIFTAATIGASQSISVGAGGLAGTSGNNAGGLGGTSNVAALLSAAGGSGGAGGAAGAGASTNGASGGAGTGGDFQVTGGCGAPGVGIQSSFVLSGSGGASYFGGGGGGSVATPTGSPAGQAYGSGAGGIANYNSGSASAGQAGKQGIIIIQEYILA